MRFHQAYIVWLIKYFHYFHNKLDLHKVILSSAELFKLDDRFAYYLKNIKIMEQCLQRMLHSCVVVLACNWIRKISLCVDLKKITRNQAYPTNNSAQIPNHIATKIMIYKTT